MIDASVAANTKDVYRNGLNCFEQFRTKYGLQSIWPPLLSHVTIFIAFLSLSNKSHNTVASYLSAINFRCKASQHAGFADNFLVSKMLEGMRRGHKSKDTRLPISADLLSRIIKMLPSICCSEFEAALFSSAFSLSFHGFLRVGEVAYNKVGQAQQVITMDNVKVVKEDGLEKIHLHILFSKTDQRGKGQMLEITETRTTICPVALLKQYLMVRPHIIGPLYCHFGGQPISRYQFSTVLNKSLRGIGIDSSRIRTHSFRIGAASSHFEKGTPQDEIKRLGRWKSDAFKRYIRTF